MLTGIDYAVIVLYFVGVAAIGWVASKRTRGLNDYFAGGHNVSWWLAGISHHVSGYSAFAFVGYASLACRVGFNVWTVFALPVFLAMLAGAYVWAPRWVRLRVISPAQDPGGALQQHGPPGHRLERHRAQVRGRGHEALLAGQGHPCLHRHPAQGHDRRVRRRDRPLPDGRRVLGRGS